MAISVIYTKTHPYKDMIKENNKTLVHFPKKRGRLWLFNQMKVFIGFLFILFIFQNLLAQQKIIQSSIKSPPDWINGVKAGYQISSGFGNSIDEAKEDALTGLRNQIAASVAVSVKLESSRFTSESIKDGAVNYFDSLAASTQIKTPDLPVFTGISLSKADDFYWEKVRNRKTKEITFRYYLKYPFTRFDEEKLIEEYLNMEKVKNEALKETLASIPGCNNVEKLVSTKKELRNLIGTLSSEKQLQAKNGIEQIDNILKSIYIKVINNRCGELTFALRSGEKYLISSKIPKVKSNCTDITGIDIVEYHYVISYSYDNCYKDDLNYLDVSFNLHGNRISKKITIDITEYYTEIFVKDPIFVSIRVDENIQIRFSIRSKYDVPFIITGMEIEVKDLSPLIVDGLEEKIEGIGKRTITVSTEYSGFKKIDETGYEKIPVNGSVFYQPADNSGIKTKRFYNIPLKIIK